MIDLKYLRDNPTRIQQAAENKKIQINVAHILEIDTTCRQLQLSVQKLREERNVLVKEHKIEEGKLLKQKLEKEENALRAVEEELKNELLKIPNIPRPDVKIGKNESENDVVKTYKEPTKFSFVPKDHVILGESLQIIDVKRAAKVSGARFAYLTNEGALLEFALIQYALEILMSKGFSPVITPELIKKETMKGLGYMENGGEEDMFYLPKDDLFLVGTAEHALVPMYMNETLQQKELPKRLLGFSSAFRREAGSYGKDTKGILRVHQFDKLEMVVFTSEEDSDTEHEYLLHIEEELFKNLDIPFRVIKMVTGDLGFPVARKYDIEAWFPSQNEYREVTSVSTITDFQSRRLGIKYQTETEKKYVHVLNGTAFAIGRTIIAILENYQQKDGSVIIPEVLRKYIGVEKISPK